MYLKGRRGRVLNTPVPSIVIKDYLKRINNSILRSRYLQNRFCKSYFDEVLIAGKLLLTPRRRLSNRSFNKIIGIIIPMLN